jgi:hypothetical protein
MYFHNYTFIVSVERTPHIMNTPVPNMGKAHFFHARKTREFIRQMEIVSSVSVTSNR